MIPPSWIIVEKQVYTDFYDQNMKQTNNAPGKIKNPFNVPSVFVA
jgi:hypothetical protein